MTTKTIQSEPTGPPPIDVYEELIEEIESLWFETRELRKEIKSLRGMVFLSMKKKKKE